jgi:hypothetical protein
MTESTDGTSRRPHVKPYVRNLDLMDTEGKLVVAPTEGATSTGAFTTPSRQS